MLAGWKTTHWWLRTAAINQGRQIVGWPVLEKLDPAILTLYRISKPFSVWSGVGDSETQQTVTKAFVPGLEADWVLWQKDRELTTMKAGLGANRSEMARLAILISFHCWLGAKGCAWGVG